MVSRSKNQEIEYKVVINHEGQYSVWHNTKDNPIGWKDIGVVGTKEDCLEHIKIVWTDMVPYSVQQK
ncbi:MAG: MbtH family NRPS accessory protein [Candidatus Thiodiazotropha sp.]